MKGKRIVVGVCGGIAAFKAASIVSQLTQLGAAVRVIMTKGALQFITSLTFQTLSKNEVYTDTFNEQDPAAIAHIDLADNTDLFIIAPATANILGKIASGIADDMLSTTLLATRAPIVFAPAMNGHMYANPTLVENIKKLSERDHHFLVPGAGQLACGYLGEGRLTEPLEIIDWIDSFFYRNKYLVGKKVLITVGPTIEPLDPVRYLANHSSGLMGMSLARAAWEAGAQVTVIHGPIAISMPKYVRSIAIQTGMQMKEAVLDIMSEMDIIIKAAAVTDYTPIEVAQQKRKKTDQWELSLRKVGDIAQEVGDRKSAKQLLVGFAAETENIAFYAQEKLNKKKLDLIIANDVTDPGAGFAVETNKVTVYDKQGRNFTFPKLSKLQLSRQLIQLFSENYFKRL